MEPMKFERLDGEGLWISEGGDHDTRLFLGMEERNDMPKIKTVTVSTDEKKVRAKTTDGGTFEIDM